MLPLTPELIAAIQAERRTELRRAFAGTRHRDRRPLHVRFAAIVGRARPAGRRTVRPA